jgi:tRNA A37 N6-isopentenylltransferase MiaA
VIESTRSSQVGGGESRWSQLWSSLQETQRQNDDVRAQLSVSLAYNEDALHEEMAEQVHASRVKLQQQTQVSRTLEILKIVKKKKKKVRSINYNKFIFP